MSGAERWLASQAGGRSSRASQDSVVYNVGMDRGNDENRSPPSAARRPSRRSTSGGHTVSWRRDSLPCICKSSVKPETQNTDVMYHESLAFVSDSLLTSTLEHQLAPPTLNCELHW